MACPGETESVLERQWNRVRQRGSLEAKRHVRIGRAGLHAQRRIEVARVDREITLLQFLDPQTQGFAYTQDDQGESLAGHGKRKTGIKLRLFLLQLVQTLIREVKALPTRTRI